MSAPELNNTAVAAMAGHTSGSFETVATQPSPAQRTHPLPQSPTSASGIHQPHNQQQQRSVKRPRPVKSCTECRKRKLRCDRLCPCSQCQKSNRACKYAADYDSANLSEGSDAEAEPGRPSKKTYGSSSGPALVMGGDPGQFANRRSADRPSSLEMGFVEELAVRMERLEKHFLSRQPSDAKPGSVPLLSHPAPSLRGLSVKRGGQRTRIFGQSSTRVLVNLFDDAKDFLSAWQHSPDIDETLLLFRKLHHSLHKDFQNSLVPMTVFVDSVMPIWKRMTDILPQKPVCDRLIAKYVDISEGLHRILHIPSFIEQYNLFWERKLQSEYFLPQLLAVLAVVSRYTTKSQGFSHERAEGVHTPTAFALVRTWLDGLKGKQLTDISVLQVELLLMVCRRSLMFRSHELWTELGRVVRMAMTMGLHRDPSEFGPRISPFIGEMRRRLWFTVCEMDLQSSFDGDMPCSIRDGDYSCQAPRNLDDEELHPDMKELPPGKPVEEYTKTQAQVLATFSLPVRSRISQLLCRIDTLRDYHEVLELGGRLEDTLEDANQIIPRHGITDHSHTSRIWRERVLCDSVVRGALLALYRPFVMNAQVCPPQMTKSFLRSCMIVLGYSEELDPMQPYHQEIMGVLHQMLRHDLVAAALSVCHFIQGPSPHPHHVNGYEGQRNQHNHHHHHLDSPNRSPALLTQGRLMWSPERLIQAVERTLGYLIQSIVQNTGTKEIFSLAVVLEMVRTPEPKSENISRVLHHTLEACLKASNSSREKIAMVKPGQGQNNGPGFATDPYHGGASSVFGYGRNPLATTPDEGWTLWGGWD